MPHVEPLDRKELAQFEPFFQAAEAMMGGFVPASLFTMGRRPEVLQAFVLPAGVINGPDLAARHHPCGPILLSHPHALMALSVPRASIFWCRSNARSTHLVLR